MADDGCEQNSFEEHSPLRTDSTPNERLNSDSVGSAPMVGRQRTQDVGKISAQNSGGLGRAANIGQPFKKASPAHHTGFAAICASIRPQRQSGCRRCDLSRANWPPPILPITAPSTDAPPQLGRFEPSNFMAMSLRCQPRMSGSNDLGHSSSAFCQDAGQFRPG